MRENNKNNFNSPKCRLLKLNTIAIACMFEKNAALLTKVFAACNRRGNYLTFNIPFNRVTDISGLPEKFTHSATSKTHNLKFPVPIEAAAQDAFTELV